MNCLVYDEHSFGATSLEDATLSLILPVRNAAAILATVMQDCLLIIPRYFEDHEIIIIDDGSTDNTLHIAHQLASQHEPVMVMRHPRRLGYARSLINGCRSARGDYILTLDVDNHISISELARMVPYLEQHDLVTAYRLHRHLPWRQRMRDTLMHSVGSGLLGLPLRDMNARFMLVRADLCDTRDLRASDDLIHTEIYARASRQRVPHVQVGVHNYMPDEVAHKAAPLRMHVRSLRQIFDLWWQLRDVHPPAAPEPEQQPDTEPTHIFWLERVVWGLGLAAVARSVWLLVRRSERSDD
jgi:glycosyltransferase involved in cell wall biosynthesis